MNCIEHNEHNEHSFKTKVSSIGSISYNLAKTIANIITPLVGLSNYHLKNTLDLVNKIRTVHLTDDEEMEMFLYK